MKKYSEFFCLAQSEARNDNDRISIEAGANSGYCRCEHIRQQASRGCPSGLVRVAAVRSGLQAL